MIDMPYASVSELPKAVRDKLSPHQQSVFRNVFNSMMEQDGMTESRAFAGAWSQSKQSVEKVDYKVGDRVSWGSSGGTARGIIRSIHREGNVPNIPVKITGSEDEPAARIELVDDEGEPRGEYVGHKLTTLRKEAVLKAQYQGKDVELDKPFRLPAGSTKKFGVYVKDGDRVKRVTFGDPNMEIRRDDPNARANFRSRHSCDTATDKTTPRYWSCRMWSSASVSSLTKEVQIEGQILKQLDEERLAFGWAYVSTVKGEISLDHSGEFIRPDQIAKAATNFMLSARTAKAMHTGEKIGEIIHSMPLTNEIAKALGIQSDREGWVIAVKVYDDTVWQDVKSGKLAAFSIGGRALKEMV